MDRQADRQKDEQTDRKTDKQAEGETNRPTKTNKSLVMEAENCRQASRKNRQTESHRQSDKHWNYFKGKVGDIAERIRSGPHTGFSERIDNLL